MKNSQNQNITLSPDRFTEKMTSKIVRMYDQPDAFFRMAKDTFLANEAQWNESEKVKAILDIFRDGYRAYSYDEKRKLGERFLDFTKDLSLSEEAFQQLYESFFLLIRKRSEAGDFLVAAIKSDCYMDIVNQDFIQEYQNPDFILFREVFVKRIEELADYLYDSTYLYIAENLTDQYTMYDNIIYALIKRDKQKVILAFLNNKNVYLSKDCLKAVIDYAKRKNNTELLKNTYRSYLYKSNFTFQDFYSYYSILTPEERKDEYFFLDKITRNNNMTPAFQLLLGERADARNLRHFTLSEFIVLSDTIKKLYPDIYQKYLLEVIKERASLSDFSYEDLSACLEKYPDDVESIFSSPEMEEVSYRNEELRYRYLTYLKEHNLFSIADIHYYRG